MNLEAIIDKAMLVVFYLGLVVFIVKGSPDHDTQMWLREGAAAILGSLLTLIKGNVQHVTQQNEISNSTVNQPTPDPSRIVIKPPTEVTQ